MYIHMEKYQPQNSCCFLKKSVPKVKKQITKGRHEKRDNSCNT
jgi:hypothetical protein